MWQLTKVYNKQNRLDIENDGKLSYMYVCIT